MTCRSMAELVEVLALSFSIITLESEAWGPLRDSGPCHGYLRK